MRENFADILVGRSAKESRSISAVFKLADMISGNEGINGVFGGTEGEMNPRARKRKHTKDCLIVATSDGERPHGLLVPKTVNGLRVYYEQMEFHALSGQ